MPRKNSVMIARKRWKIATKRYDRARVRAGRAYTLYLNAKDKEVRAEDALSAASRHLNITEGFTE